MAENRTNRELQTREKTARKRAWTRPETLPSPIPQDGWSFHWVRIATRGEADTMNFSSKLREGWEPCKTVDHPEIQLLTVENDRFKDNIVIGGLMLCKAPTEMVEDRAEHYQDQTESQMRSVDHSFMRENDPRMPLFNERKTKVTFGKGN